MCEAGMPVDVGDRVSRNGCYTNHERYTINNGTGN